MKQSPLLEESPKKILLPRFDTMGDIILFEGFLEALLSKYPDPEITMVVQEIYLQLKPLFPERIKWLSTKAYPYREPDKNELELLMSLLAEEDWDLILTTTFNRTYIDESIALKFKHVRNIAIGGERHIPWSLKNIWRDLGINIEQPTYEYIPVEEFSHETEKYRELWKSLTGENKLPNPRLIISEDLAKHANDLLSSLDLREKAFCICNPAGIANIAIKAWPEDRFAEIIVWLEREYNLLTLVTGHEKESEKIEKVVNIAKSKGAKPLSWLGKDGEITRLAAITQQAKLYFGNDTGPMHIAAALGKPTVGIFGGGHWPRFLPTGNRTLGVANPIPCFGCDWDCIFQDAPCVSLVQVDDVKKAINKILNEPIEGSNIFYAAQIISEETSKFIDKAKIKFKLKTSSFRNILETCEADRAARLEVIHSQAREFTSKFNECEKDRAARLEVIHEQEDKFNYVNNKLHDFEVLLKQSCDEIYKIGGDLSHLSKLFEIQKIDFGTEEVFLFLCSGWSHNETIPDEGYTFNWAIGDSASLFLSLPKDKSVQLSSHLKSLTFPEPQIVTVKLDGKEIGKWQLSNIWQWEKHSITLEPDEYRPAVSIIEFFFSQKRKPERDDRQLAVLFESISLNDIRIENE